MGKQPRPYIGVNADLAFEVAPQKVGRPPVKQAVTGLRLNLGYLDTIVAAGGLPVVVPPFQRDVDLDAYLDRLDGFVLSGSPADLDPRRHGLPTHPAVHLLPERRDDSDRQLVRKLIARRMPMLAIGLGMQQLNVACGGTLILHLPEELPRGLPHRDPTGQPHRHTAFIEPGSRLEEIYGPGEICVNSSHHQSVRQAGKGLRVAAVAPDGVVEAVETTDADWYCLGVQWHPEAETATALDLQLFECLIQACLREEPALRMAG